MNVHKTQEDRRKCYLCASGRNYFEKQILCCIINHFKTNEFASLRCSPDKKSPEAGMQEGAVGKQRTLPW